VVWAPVADTEAGWNSNSTGDRPSGNDLAINGNGTPTGPWQFVNGGFPRGAFEIDGAPAAVVPEPASLVLLGVGALGLGGYAGRRKAVA
jgi:hypothetical protein